MANVSTGLDDAQTDRVSGVLLGLACGDALGTPYEGGDPPGPDETADMVGGGPAGLAPGEWSDDTALAVVIADVAATGADLREPAGLDAVAEGFLEWYARGGDGVGRQTAAVLGAAREQLDRGAEGVSPGAVVTECAAAYARDHERAAGNGALSRTAPVALAHLDDRDALAEAARAVAALTHADPLAGDACVLWCEAVRVAVVAGHFDVRGGLDLLPSERRGAWAGWIDDALEGPASDFTPNGGTVAALQAATSAVVLTPASHDGPPSDHLGDALHNAVRVGDDTDTVAAIAGALLGARWGASGVPQVWREKLHGWPGRTGEDLVGMALCAATARRTGG